MHARPLEVLIALRRRAGLALGRARGRLGGLAGDDARNRVVVEGAVTSGVAQGLGDACHADPVGELENLAHVVAGRAAVQLDEARGEGLRDRAESLKLILEDMPARARGPKFRLVLGGDVALILRRAHDVRGHDRGVDQDLDPPVEHAHHGALRREARRHGVAVGVPRHAEVGAHETRHDHAGLEARPWQRDEHRLLLREAGRGLLARRAVHPHTRDLGEPRLPLPVEVVEIMKRPSRKEVAFHVLEGVFDLAFALLIARRKRDGAEAVVLRHPLEERMEDHAVLEALQHDLLHPVIEDLVRHTAGVLERQDVAVTDGVDVGMEHEADEVPAAVAEHEGEADDRRGLTREQHRIGRQVDLALDAGRGLEAQVGSATRRRPEGPHVELEDAVAAGVADGPDLLEHAHAAQLVGENELVDERLERIELARAPLALALDLAPEDGAHRPGINPELTRNGPIRPALAVEASDQVVAPLPSLTLALAIVLADPSSVVRRETAFSTVRSRLLRIWRSFLGGGAPSRRLASVTTASSRCKQRHSRCLSGDRRGSTGGRRVSGWCFRRLARGSESSARRATGSFVRCHRLTSSSVSRGPSLALPTTAASSSWLPGGNESSRRADPGCSIPSFIDSKSSGCRRSTRPIRRLTQHLWREHSAAISACVRPVLASSRNTSPSSNAVIDEGPRLSSSIVAHCPVSSSGVTATTIVDQPSVVAAASRLKPSTSSTPSGLGTATRGVNWPCAERLCFIRSIRTGWQQRARPSVVSIVPIGHGFAISVELVIGHGALLLRLVGRTRRDRVPSAPPVSSPPISSTPARLQRAHRRPDSPASVRRSVGVSSPSSSSDSHPLAPTSSPSPTWPRSPAGGCSGTTVLISAGACSPSSSSDSPPPAPTSSSSATWARPPPSDRSSLLSPLVADIKPASVADGA